MASSEIVRIGFAKQPFMQTIGAQLASVGLGKCEIFLPFDAKLTQQHGFFHGGVISTIADNAAGFAAYSLMSKDCQPLSIEFKVSLLSVATGKPLIARAEVLKAGRKIFHVRSDVLIVEEDDEELVATALATIKSSKSVKEI